MRSEKEIRERLKKMDELIEKQKGIYAPEEYYIQKFTLEWVLGLRDK